MQSMPILTIQAAEKLLNALEDFLEKSEGHFALVLDRGGIILSQHGTLPDTADTNVVSALSAGCFAATRELALRVGETDCSALYQQGANSHIFICAIDQDHILVTIFGKQTTVGLVKFYSARATKRIAAVLQEIHSGAGIGGLFSKNDLNDAAELFIR